MAIRPTIRLIDANWRDQTVAAFRSVPSRDEEETKRTIPRGEWSVSRDSTRVNMENRPGFRGRKTREGKRCVYTFCSRSWASRTSAVWPTARIFSSRVSIRANQTSTSFLFASYRWLSPSIASNSVFLCIIFEFISSQCSLSFVTETTIGRTCRSQTFSSVPLYVSIIRFPDQEWFFPFLFFFSFFLSVFHHACRKKRGTRACRGNG